MTSTLEDQSSFILLTLIILGCAVGGRLCLSSWAKPGADNADGHRGSGSPSGENLGSKSAEGNEDAADLLLPSLSQ